jgi:hypothetical protein
MASLRTPVAIADQHLAAALNDHRSESNQPKDWGLAHALVPAGQNFTISGMSALRDPGGSA